MTTTKTKTETTKTETTKPVGKVGKFHKPIDGYSTLQKHHDIMAAYTCAALDVANMARFTASSKTVKGEKVETVKPVAIRGKVNAERFAAQLTTSARGYWRKNYLAADGSLNEAGVKNVNNRVVGQLGGYTTGVALIKQMINAIHKGGKHTFKSRKTGQSVTVQFTEIKS